MDDLSFSVTRDLTICARVETVWEYLSTDEGWAAWWGPGSSIKAVPGGAMHIAYPNGQTAEGTVQEVEPPRRIVFTWGFDRPDPVVPLEGSLVEITLEATDGGTHLRLVHRVADEAAAQAHRTGWRYQLGLFRTLLSRDILGRGLAARIDRWHAVWAVTDGAERRRMLDEIATADLVVDESMAALNGIDDLDEWIAQSQAQFTAAVRRTGPPAVSAERATWDWEVVAGGASLATGRSTADLGADGRFRRITSFWLSVPPGFPTSVVTEDA
jgi:uncharacterized protein YndB with AHSA1/START domain